MSYEMFISKVNALIARANEGTTKKVRARFFVDEGRFFAKCSDGVTIVGNSQSRKVLVRFGSGHRAAATL